MTQHNHKHSESHRHARGSEGESSGKQFHKDWRVWLAVAIMLAATIIYVLTLDDSVVPSIMRQ
ncbi:MAG: hypothetical protein ACLP5H_23460 [Desulfomonilaceae bacterium]